MISEEQNTSVLAGGTVHGFDPLTSSHAGPHALQEAHAAIFCIAPVVLTHDRLDCLGCLIRIVERDGADIVVKDVSLDDTMKKGTADESELAIDGSRCPTDIVPAARGVMRECGIGVLEECDGNCRRLANKKSRLGNFVPSQWLTQRYGKKYQTNMLVQPNF